MNPDANSVALNFLLELQRHAQPMYLALPDGTLLYANDAYRELLRLSPKDQGPGLTGETLPEPHRSVVADVAASGRQLTHQESFPTAANDHNAGRTAYLAEHFPILDSERQVSAVGGCLFGVVPGSHLSQLLREEKQRFFDVTRASSDWIWETDAKGHITFISDRIAEMIGLPPQLLRGKQLDSLVQFRCGENERRVPSATVLNGRPFRNVFARITTPGGDLRAYHISGVPRFDERGRFAGYRGTGTDVTELVRTEQTLKRTNSELEATLRELSAKNMELDKAVMAATNATRAKDMFLASMSHELRTPLNAVLGFAEAMELGILGPLQENYKRYVGHILHAGRHLLTLIEDILDIARIESGGLPLHIEPLQLEEIVNEAMLLIQQQARERRMDISGVTVDPSYTVLGDRTRCMQIITNLLSNAVKYTPAGGSIGISIELDETPPRMVHTTVWDTGVGIAPDMRERIFDVFNRGEQDVHARAGEGAGIGLAIAQRLARQMGGDIRVESTVGKGSRFIVKLPAADEMTPAERPATAASVVSVARSASA